MMDIKPKFAVRSKRILSAVLCFLSAGLLTPVVYAQSLGQVADNIWGPLSGASHLIKIVCMVAGAGLIMGSLMRYKAHRDNPVEVRLGTAVAMLLAGIALILVSFIPMPTQT